MSLPCEMASHKICIYATANIRHNKHINGVFCYVVFSLYELFNMNDGANLGICFKRFYMYPLSPSN